MDRMDLTVALQARGRAVMIARCAIWIGWMVLVIGGGMARGPVSIGVLVAGYGIVLIVAGVVTWLRNRSPRSRDPVRFISTGEAMRHARAHAHSIGHPIVQSFEAGENWRWCYVHENYV